MNTTARIRRGTLAVAPLVIALAGFGGPAAQAAPVTAAAANPISVTRLAGPAQIAVVEADAMYNADVGAPVAKKPVVKKPVTKKAATKTVATCTTKKIAKGSKKTVTCPTAKAVKKTVKKAPAKKVVAKARSAK